MLKAGLTEIDVDKHASLCVVDDDRSVRSSIVTLMRSIGLEASSFASGEAFLQSEGIGALRCLILDVRMKRMSGLDVQRELLEAGHDIPIVFISAHADGDARERATKAGAIAFLMKPFSQDELLGCVHAAMGDKPREPE